MQSTVELRRGQAGWFLLGTLGVSCVIAGEFAAWNWGLGRGGWGGMLLATLAMAALYGALVLCVAELASIVPTAGAGYGFARFAFGPAAGFLTGFAVTIQYVLACAVVAIFFQAYFAALTGISGWLVPTTCFVLGCGLHCLGVGAAMRVMVALAALALLAIGVFVVVGAPHATLEKLWDIPVSPHAVLSSRWMPFGVQGVWACLPYAVAGFVGVESIALAAEEARDPVRDVPRGLVLALGTLVVTLLAVLWVAPAVEGSAALSRSDSPLVDALAALGNGKEARALRAFVNVAGLIGLAASFFSAVFAYSRQVFALSRAGYLPAVLSKLNARRVPWAAIVVPGALAWVLTLTGAGDPLYVLVIFAALAAYLLIFAAHIRLRTSQRRWVRPYRTPGGTRTAWIGLVLTGLTFIACFLASPTGSWMGVGLLLGALIYFKAYARRRLIAQAPEEELALAKAAEAALDLP